MHMAGCENNFWKRLLQYMCKSRIQRVHVKVIHPRRKEIEGKESCFALLYTLITLSIIAFNYKFSIVHQAHRSWPLSNQIVYV